MSRIRIVVADITTLQVDAIVNAANTALTGGGGVDGAIHRAAGNALLEECRNLGRCPTGSARVTNAYNLPARMVIHAVGPVWQGGDSGEPDLLASCYRTALELAVENEARSIAFPAISCGVYRFPPDRAAVIAWDEITKFLETDESLDRVVLACFDQRMAGIYHRLQ